MLSKEHCACILSSCTPQIRLEVGACDLDKTRRTILFNAYEDGNNERCKKMEAMTCGGKMGQLQRARKRYACLAKQQQVRNFSRTHVQALSGASVQR